MPSRIASGTASVRSIVRISASNRSAFAAPLHLLPTLWFKNDWSWTGEASKPRITVEQEGEGLTPAGCGRPARHLAQALANSSGLIGQDRERRLGRLLLAAVRGNGVGYATGMGRISAIVGPIVVGWLFAA